MDITSHTEIEGNKITLCIYVEVRIAVIAGKREMGHR